MYKIKKILCMILSVIVVVTGNSVWAADKTEKINLSQYEDSLNKLYSFGIIKSASVEEYNSEIALSDFLDMCVRAGGLLRNEPFGGDAEGTYNIMDYAGNLVSADSSLEASVEYNTAVDIALRVLGYNEATVKSNNADLLSGINYVSGNVTKYGAVLLVNNMLDSSVVEYDASEKSYSISQSTLAETALKIFSKRGVIVGTSVTMVDGESKLNKNEFALQDSKGVRYICTSDKIDTANEKLGMSVELFYKEGDDCLESVYIKDRTNNIITVVGSEITGFNKSSRTVKYDDEKGKTQKIDFAKSINVIYNSHVTDDNDFVYEKIENILNGNNASEIIDTIRVVDNNNDGKYELAFINIYSNTTVQEIINNEDIVCKGNNVYKLNPENGTETENYFYDADKNPITISDIMPLSILSVSESMFSGKKIMTFVQSKDSEEGVITYQSGSKVRIDGKEYILDPKLKDKVKVGEKYTVKLDFKKTIAECTADCQITSVAYLVKAYAENDGKCYAYAYIPSVYDTNSSMELTKMRLSDKLKVNGVTVDADFDFDSILFELLYYKTNSKGEISYIQLPGTDSSANKLLYMNSNNKKKQVRNYVLTGMQFLSANLGESFLADKETQFLFLPLNKKAYDADLYEAARYHYKELYQGDYYTDAFVLDDSKYTADIVCVYYTDKVTVNTEMTGNIYSTYMQSIYAVEETGQSLNKDGVTGAALWGMNLMPVSQTESIATFASEKTLDYLTKREKDINSGDIVQVFLDRNGNAVSFRKLYDYERDTYGDFKYALRRERYAFLGKVYAVEDDKMAVVEQSKNMQTENIEIYTLPSRFLKYNSEKKKAELTDKSALKDYRSFGDECSKVFIFGQSGAARAVYIIE